MLPVANGHGYAQGVEATRSFDRRTAQTLRWFEEWVTDKATRQTILVDTPARLYGF